MAKITKSKGTTKSERYLAQLGEKSFLNLWSYPNVYRKQGQMNGGDGKEFCDLFVVCGDHVIIFSDKTVNFTDSGNIDTDWKRWFKRAVKKSADQLYGAERWLDKSQFLFLDPKCNHPLPIDIPLPGNRKVHLVVVALGAGDRCKQRFKGGSGSLMIIPDLKGNGHIDVNAPGYRPFSVGDIDPSQSFIHVFDDVTLDIILGELDTITDLVIYLDKKEKFIRSGHLGGATGEDELLAVYLADIDENGQHGFFSPSGNSEWEENELVTIIEGHWEKLKNHPQYLAKKKADKVSYLWDSLITKFTKHMMDGTSISLDGRALNVREQERGGVRYMALENRLTRRALSSAINDAINVITASNIFVRTIPPPPNHETAYIFMQLPFNSSQTSQSYENYKNYRICYLEAYCLVVNSKHKNFKRVIGIATEPPKFTTQEDLASEDLCLVEVDEWNEEMKTLAKNAETDFQVFQRENIQSTHYSTQEYPETRTHSLTTQNATSEPASPNRAERRRAKAVERKLAKKKKRNSTYKGVAH